MKTEDSLGRLKKLVLEFRNARGWEPFHTPKDLAAALAVEAAELQEIFLWLGPEEVKDALAEPGKRSRVAEELADILIFLLYLAEACGVDLAAALEAKLLENARKYPVSKSYGSNKKYTEL
jgi:NTP pyrophosphatase (non-canonical NTP hydrolase)